MALLFREQKRDGVSWLLGRTTGYELQTVFETAVAVKRYVHRRKEADKGAGLGNLISCIVGEGWGI